MEQTSQAIEGENTVKKEMSNDQVLLAATDVSVQELPAQAIPSIDNATSTDAPPLKRPRGRPPLSRRNTKGQAQSRLWSSENKSANKMASKASTSSKSSQSSSLGHSSQLSHPTTPKAKGKVGTVIRAATHIILSRLLTEEPLSLAALRAGDVVKDLPSEQVQDILDVLQVMGLVRAVQDCTKTSHTASPPPSPSSNGSGSGGSGVGSKGGTAASQGTGVSSSPQKHGHKVTSDLREVLFTMTEFARGPAPPDHVWNLYADMVSRRERTADLKRRADVLEKLIESLPAPAAPGQEESDEVKADREKQALQMLMRYMEDTSTDSGLRLIEDQGDALYRAVTDAVISILPAATCGG